MTLVLRLKYIVSPEESPFLFYSEKEKIFFFCEIIDFLESRHLVFKKINNTSVSKRLNR